MAFIIVERRNFKNWTQEQIFHFICETYDSHRVGQLSNPIFHEGELLFVRKSEKKPPFPRRIQIARAKRF